MYQDLVMWCTARPACDAQHALQLEQHVRVVACDSHSAQKWTMGVGYSKAEGISTRQGTNLKIGHITLFKDLVLPHGVRWYPAGY